MKHTFDPVATGLAALWLGGAFIATHYLIVWLTYGAASRLLYAVLLVIIMPSVITLSAFVILKIAQIAGWR